MPEDDFLAIDEGGLRIRPLHYDDLPYLYKWLNDDRVLRFYGGRDRPYENARILREFYPKSPIVSKNMVLWQATRIGYVQFYPVIGQQLATYGYLSRRRVYGIDQFIGEPQYWNRGIGTKLVSGVCHWLFKKSNVECVVVDPRCDNMRAIHVYQKCGFRKVMRLTAHEWHEQTRHDCWLMEKTRH